MSVENRLFETLDPTTRGFEHEGRRYLVTDTVGFIRRLPTQLVEGFASTLEETLVADLVLHVVDASESDDRLDEMIAAVDAVLHEIGADDVPLELVLNKIDLVDPLGRRRLANRFPDALQISAATGEGVGALQARIAERFADRFEDVGCCCRTTRAGKLAELYALGAPIEEREDSEEGVLVRARLPQREVRRFAPYLVAERATSAAAKRVLAVVARPCRTLRCCREASFSRLASAIASRSSPASVASWAAYQSTSPSSAAMASRRSSVRVPPSSRMAFFTFSAVSPASPQSPRRDSDVAAEVRIDGGRA